MVGWLVADNLIEHKPTSKPQLEVFALYALTIAAQLARKQAVADLRDSEALFRSFVEAAPEGIVICNRQGVITLVNAQAETLFGYRRDELIGQAVELLLPVAQRDGHRQHREQYATAPYQRPAAALPELPARRKDGSQFLAAIQLSAVPKQDELLVISLITDVTERNWAEQALRASEVHLRELQQLLHTVIETLPVRVFWKDRDFELSWQQPAVRAGCRAHGIRATGRQKRFRLSLDQPSACLSSRRSGGHGKWVPPAAG